MIFELKNIIELTKNFAIMNLQYEPTQRKLAAKRIFQNAQTKLFFT